MAGQVVIKATARQRRGKGAARAVRREGKIPGVLYGDKQTAEAITLDYNDLNNLFHKGRFLATVLQLDIDGRKSRAVPRDVQLDPVKDTPIHVDFQRIGADNRVKLKVPVKFANEALSPGLKRGGVLNIVRRDIEVWCPADEIPEHFEVNLEGLEIGRSVKISAIKLGPGVSTTIIGRDFTIATIAGKKAEEEEAKPAAEVEVAAEGEAPAEGAAAAPGAAAAAPGDAKAAAAGAKAATPPAAGGKGAVPAGAGDKGKK